MGRAIVGKVLVLAVIAVDLTLFGGPARAQGQLKGQDVRRAPAQASAPAPRNAAPAPQPAAGAIPAQNSVAAAARMKKLLRDWELQSSRLKTLVVRLERTDTRQGWGKEQFSGLAMFKSPNYAFLDFKQLVNTDPKKPVFTDYQRIICTGNEVWQYLCPEKQIFIYTLDKQMRKRALEEGPLPFLFNMKAAEAEARYRMELLRETETHFVIGVKPLLNVDQEAFSQALLNLRKSDYLPDRITLLMPNEKDTKDFVLRKVEPNKVVPEANFKGIAVKGWTLKRDPQKDIAAPAAAEQPKAVGNRPATPAAAGRR